MLLDTVRHPNIVFGWNLISKINSLYDAEFRVKTRVRQKAINSAKADVRRIKTSIKTLHYIMKTNSSEFDLSEIEQMKRPKTVKEWKERLSQITDIIYQEAIGLPKEFCEEARKFNIDSFRRHRRMAYDRNGRWKGDVLDNKGFEVRHFSGLSDTEIERIREIGNTFNMNAHFINLDNNFGR